MRPEEDLSNKVEDLAKNLDSIVPKYMMLTTDENTEIDEKNERLQQRSKDEHLLNLID